MSAIDELVVRRRGRLQVALVAGGRLCELRSDDPDPARPGAVIMGRVQTPAPDGADVFVDIGAGRAGYLRQADMIGGAQDRPQPGDPVLVQVVRIAGEGKGARLSMKIALPGRFVVLRPQETGVSVSERIDDNAERGRLVEALSDMAAEAGLTVRTAAADIDGGVLREEALRLAQAWDAVRAQALTARPPVALATPDDALAEAIRETGHGLRRVAVEETALRRRVETLRAFHGDGFAVETLSGDPPAFELHDIEAQLEQALAPEVALPGGGSIAIEPTRAFVAIDVDSGTARNAVSVNLEAAEVVAQQLRLRNLGGAVLVDFIAMRQAADRDRVLGRLALHLAADPVPAQVLGWTRLGLVELSRARRGRTLAAALAGTAEGGGESGA